MSGIHCCGMSGIHCCGRRSGIHCYKETNRLKQEALEMRKQMMLMEKEVGAGQEVGAADDGYAGQDEWRASRHRRDARQGRTHRLRLQLQNSVRSIQSALKY